MQLSLSIYKNLCLTAFFAVFVTLFAACSQDETRINNSARAESPEASEVQPPPTSKKEMVNILSSSVESNSLWDGYLPDYNGLLQSTQSKRAMVVAANPYAVRAGLYALETGGSAVDAAIAVQAVLTLTEPQSSGIGGGAFMLYYDAGTKQITQFDGREKAPASAHPNMFLNEEGEALGFLKAKASPRAVGVPGAVAMLSKAHQRFGKKEWGENWHMATQLAEDGFLVSLRLSQILHHFRPYTSLDDHPESAAYFYPGGEALPAGSLKKNPELAESFRLIAEDPRNFYEGKIAQDLVARLGADDQGRPIMTAEDLASYNVLEKEPICTLVAELHYCSARPPSSGGFAIGQIMAIYERLQSQFPDGRKQTRPTLDELAAMITAQRLAYADRDHYIADEDFVPIPLPELMQAGYLDQRIEAFGSVETSAPHIPPGNPGLREDGSPWIDAWGRDMSKERAGTSHFSIIDAQGNAISMTTTIESVFGNGRMVGGFLLNNQLTDFARIPALNGKPVANAPAPQKRPRSSMSPTLVLNKDRNFVAATGSPGGNSIIAYTSKSLIAHFYWGLPIKEAIDFGNIIARGDSTKLEREAISEEQQTALRERGFALQLSRRGENSGLHMIKRDPETGLLQGAADKRREGEARGF